MTMMKDVEYLSQDLCMIGGGGLLQGMTLYGVFLRVTISGAIMIWNMGLQRQQVP